MSPCTAQHAYPPPFPALPAALFFAIAGLFIWWPLGLIVLALLIWRRNMMFDSSCHSRSEHPFWRHKAKFMRWHCGAGFAENPSSSGNNAFDKYKAETLQRLDEEQKEFEAFVRQLREAKDKAEFDQFIADRKARGSGNRS